MSNLKQIVLKSSDGVIFEIEEAVALQSQTIGDMVETDTVENGIIISNVTGEILARVIKYCKKHVDGGLEENLKNWDAEFMKTTDDTTLCNLIVAAKYLNIASLLDLTCQTLADMIRGKTRDEIRTLLNIGNDLTLEEEDKFRQENKWTFK